MLKEALQFLQQTILEGSAVTIIDAPGDPTKKLIRTKGGYEQFVVPPPLRDHHVDGLADFLSAVNRWGTQGVVFHFTNKCVCLLDDGDRREKVVFDLDQSEQFSTILGLRERDPMDQREFVDLLRHDLKGAVADTLLAKIRKIDFTTGGSASQEVQHGRERGTREFIAEIAGAADIPEVVDLKVSVYRNPGLNDKHTIRCSLACTLPPAHVTFALRPLPDEVDIALENAQAQLHTLLEDGVPEGVGVFHGTP